MLRLSASHFWLSRHSPPECTARRFLSTEYTIERFSLITPRSTSTFHRGGATEQAREQIGVVTLHVGDGEDATSFLDNVEIRIRHLQKDSLSSSQAPLQTGCVEVTRLVQDVLKPAALSAIRKRERRDRSMNATQTYPVFVVYIERSRAGTILTEPTSFHDSLSLPAIKIWISLVVGLK
ncbi:hypothetical protein N7520_009960 [Penicillium odoratum]|uniref:uncharacterized protein n=1 Tax=Penicillium odoratum TaxID=1167516 RepID=UPI0025480B04|nr:uncharacterized protein N7520_009960 [Penicillium odoratum]KAJ5753043.1 hypothetical protein N7520_009960 [Penicillium odoratum]